MEYGIVKKVMIEANLDDEKKSRMAKVEIYGEDIVTVEYTSRDGIDRVPVVGERVYFDSITPTYNLAVLPSDETIVPEDLKEGERESYAVVNGKRVSTIRQNVEGEIILDSGKDYAVKFTELKKAFDDLVLFVNEHIHPTTATIGDTSTVGVISPVIKPYSGNVDKAKVEKVLI